jgi:cytochrome c biogenesis protein CcdA
MSADIMHEFAAGGATASAVGGHVVQSQAVAEPTTERRWKTFADVVAFALGTNVWISIVILPAIFIGALHGAARIAAAALPFVVLMLGLARRSEAVLLGLFPAAVLVPVAL